MNNFGGLSTSTLLYNRFEAIPKVLEDQINYIEEFILEHLQLILHQFAL
jgi:hypothetical protein